MRGLMMETPLLVSSLIKHAASVFFDQEIVSRMPGGIHRYTYRDAEKRARQLAKALIALGVKKGDRIATLAWNDHRHFEIYYAVSGMEAICHTVNPRLFSAQVTFILNHAEDKYVFCDPMFLPLIEDVLKDLKKIKGVILMADRKDMPESSLDLVCYEDLLEAQSDDFSWPSFDENTAAALCYTSGTTGNPKGVLYSHRALVLHSWMMALPDSLHLGEHECVMPVVPMFHVNAWGIPYAAPMVGAKLVLPGRSLDGKSLHEMISTENVSVTAGVPTLWLGLLNHLEEVGGTLDSLERLVVGGSAIPPSMISAFEKNYDVRSIHAWGMTEMTPLGTLCLLKPDMADLPEEERLRIQGKQGRKVFGIEMKITDDADVSLPHDGKAFGDLQVRGPWVCKGYYGLDNDQALSADGWFSTSDVATIDENGYMQITDRSKDVIKSGGEWISSIDLENIAVAHPAVAEAAVIGIPHPKWDERPLLVIVKKQDSDLEQDEILSFFKGKCANWWIPEDVAFVDEIPHTATGKISKLTLRQQFTKKP
jgi:3-(methylthio)propionyl---CoA ligase